MILHLTPAAGGGMSRLATESTLHGWNRSSDPTSAAGAAPPEWTPSLLPSALQPVDQPSPSENDLRRMADQANAYLRRVETHLQFRLSEQTGRVVILIVDSRTNEVLRQIPPASLRQIVQRLDQMRGLLFDTQG